MQLNSCCVFPQLHIFLWRVVWFLETQCSVIDVRVLQEWRSHRSVTSFLFFCHCLLIPYRGLYLELWWQHVHEDHHAYGHAYRSRRRVLPFHVPACLWAVDGNHLTRLCWHSAAGAGWRPCQTYGQFRYRIKTFHCPFTISLGLWLVVFFLIILFNFCWFDWIGLISKITAKTFVMIFSCGEKFSSALLHEDLLSVLCYGQCWFLSL